jgi:hypothetical protein
LTSNAYRVFAASFHGVLIPLLSADQEILYAETVKSLGPTRAFGVIENILPADGQDGMDKDRLVNKVAEVYPESANGFRRALERYEALPRTLDGNGDIRLPTVPEWLTASLSRGKTVQ